MNEQLSTFWKGLRPTKQNPRNIDRAQLADRRDDTTISCLRPHPFKKLMKNMTTAQRGANGFHCTNLNSKEIVAGG